MHNRFVLSEVGGLSFQIGLDDGNGDEDRPIDLATLLELDSWAVELQNYQGVEHVGRWL